MIDYAALFALLPQSLKLREQGQKIQADMSLVPRDELMQFSKEYQQLMLDVEEILVQHPEHTNDEDIMNLLAVFNYERAALCLLDIFLAATNENVG